MNKLSPFKFASLLMAVWFTANAFGNKFAGLLSALLPEKGHSTSLFGYQINTTYDFFLIFVVMAGTASLILFMITKKLQVMMNEENSAVV